MLNQPDETGQNIANAFGNIMAVAHSNGGESLVYATGQELSEIQLSRRRHVHTQHAYDFMQAFKAGHLHKRLGWLRVVRLNIDNTFHALGASAHPDGGQVCLALVPGIHLKETVTWLSPSIEYSPKAWSERGQGWEINKSEIAGPWIQTINIQELVHLALSLCTTETSIRISLPANKIGIEALEQLIESAPIWPRELHIQLHGVGSRNETSQTCAEITQRLERFKRPLAVSPGSKGVCETLMEHLEADWWIYDRQTAKELQAEERQEMIKMLINDPQLRGAIQMRSQTEKSPHHLWRSCFQGHASSSGREVLISLVQQNPSSDKQHLLLQGIDRPQLTDLPWLQARNPHEAKYFTRTLQPQNVIIVYNEDVEAMKKAIGSDKNPVNIRESKRYGYVERSRKVIDNKKLKKELEKANFIVNGQLNNDDSDQEAPAPTPAPATTSNSKPSCAQEAKKPADLPSQISAAHSALKAAVTTESNRSQKIQNRPWSEQDLLRGLKLKADQASLLLLVPEKINPEGTTEEDAQAEQEAILRDLESVSAQVARSLGARCVAMTEEGVMFAFAPGMSMQISKLVTRACAIMAAELITRDREIDLIPTLWSASVERVRATIKEESVKSQIGRAHV